MFVPCSTQENNFTDTSQRFSIASKQGQASARSTSLGDPSAPIVLFCNPNAVFYEYLNYQSEWLNYYTKTLGCNMIIFNYRGYGRSSMKTSTSKTRKYFGLMNPDDIMKDTEVVLEYALEKFATSQNKIVVHGESMGGMAAAYVAMRSALNKQIHVDMAFIDRTFSSLDNVAYWSAGVTAQRSNPSKKVCGLNPEAFSQHFGKFVSRVFRLVTLWKDNTAMNYA